MSATIDGCHQRERFSALGCAAAIIGGALRDSRFDSMLGALRNRDGIIHESRSGRADKESDRIESDAAISRRPVAHRRSRPRP